MRYIEHAAASRESTDLRVDLHVFSGLHENGGGIVNIRESNFTVGQLFRAAFEHMAENYYAAAMKLDPHVPWKHVVFSGGLIAQSTLLERLVTEKFGLPARMSPTQEAKRSPFELDSGIRDNGAQATGGDGHGTTHVDG